jgi:phosphate transport system substrate-binding protein
MKLLPRSSWVVLLLIILSFAFSISAQEDSENIIAGSGIVSPVLEALTVDTDLDVVYRVDGSTAGIQALCNGDVLGAGASRPMSIDEDATCITNDVEYVELLVAHHVLTFVAHPEDTFLSCLTVTDMNALFAPSASVATNTWLDVNPEYPEEPVSVVLPADNTLTYASLDRVVDGDGLRADATVGTADEVLDTVAQTIGAVGIVSLRDALPREADVQILDADFGDNALGCNFPTVESVEDRLYSGSDQLYLYLRRDAIETVRPLVDALLNEDNGSIIEEAGFSAPSGFAYGTNEAIISGEEDNRSFTQDVVTFEIPSNLSGTLGIAGSPVVSNFINSVVTSLTTQFTALTVDVRTLGETDGVRRFCNGEVAMVVVSDALSEEQTTACEANNITPSYYDLGKRAVVMVANEADDFAICLTTDQITRIWSAESTDVVGNWQDVGESFPDTNMTLFGISAGDSSSDVLLMRDGMPPAPIRTDTELNADALYRAAATANVEGALTYMPWTDYERVLANNQANIQLVAVDGGNGCVVPSEATIDDGSYVLTQSAQLAVAENALTDVVAQSVLWTMFSDSNYIALERTGLVGISFSDLPDLREQLQTDFALAEESSDSAEDMPDTPDAEATAEAPEAESTEAADTSDE